MTRICRSCGQLKPLDRFALVRHRSDNIGQRNECMDCNYAARKKRRLANPSVLQAAREVDRKAHRKQRSTPLGWCKRLIVRLKHKTAKLGVPFDLSVEDIMAVFPIDGKCPALGVAFEFGRRSPNNPSLDRIRPELGYIKGNIAVICRRANAIKQDAASEELFRVAAWARQVEKNRDHASARVIRARALRVVGASACGGIDLCARNATGVSRPKETGSLDDATHC